RILNPEGTRFPDEFVRHKVLDAVGDLALAGGPLLGTYRSVRGGHKLNHALVCALMSDTSAWTWVEGEMPRPIPRHAEMASRLAPAFGPEMSKNASLWNRFRLPHSGRNGGLFAWASGNYGRRRGDKGKPVEPRAGDGIHPIHGWAFSDHWR